MDLAYSLDGQTRNAYRIFVWKQLGTYIRSPCETTMIIPLGAIRVVRIIRSDES
jgi:hypothetical protein